MTKIKLCGLTRVCDMKAANICRPEYVGFVFVKKSRRYLTEEEAVRLKEQLLPNIAAVGVFVDEDPKIIAGMLKRGVIDMAQLHGNEEEKEIEKLQRITGKSIIKAFSVKSEKDIQKAMVSPADYVLLDSGNGGTGIPFDWKLLKNLTRPYFIAGGLGLGNIKEVIRRFHPYGVDISSGIESGGRKDPEKMETLVRMVRETERK